MPSRLIRLFAINVLIKKNFVSFFVAQSRIPLDGRISRRFVVDDFFFCFSDHVLHVSFRVKAFRDINLTGQFHLEILLFNGFTFKGEPSVFKLSPFPQLFQLMLSS